MSNIAIIPARGASKGIPRKNLMLFCGKPLIAWSILQARGAREIEHVYVSSEDAEILEVAQSYGAIAIQRPIEFSTDTATSEEALLHALELIESETGLPDLVVFLQATSPLRTSEDIYGAVDTLRREQADSLFSMAILDDFTVWHTEGGKLRGLTFDPANRGRRQDRKPVYLENGSIYVFSPDVLRRNRNRIGQRIAMFAMPIWKAHEIDTIENVEVCEFFFRKYLLPPDVEAGS